MMSELRALASAAALCLVVGALPLAAAAKAPSFADVFKDRTLRIDCTFSGDAKSETVTVDRLVEEGPWAGPLAVSIDPFNNGHYELRVYDVPSNALVYSRGFDCILNEYATTAPALAGKTRAFRVALTVPMPSHPVVLVIEARDRQNILHPIKVQLIDPSRDKIEKARRAPGDRIFRLVSSGDPHGRVDLVLLAEGYTESERAKFRSDAERAVTWLFGVEPYRSHRKDFNVYGVFRPSPQSGVSEPTRHVVKRTALGASFDALGMPRYLLAEDGWRLRAVADQAPCDDVVVLVNTDRYGGGGIYNDTCIFAADNERSRMLFLHEFGHAFAGLADEYIDPETVYSDTYPKGVEPLEPNITAYLDPPELKWKGLLSPGIALPTDWGEDEILPLWQKAAEGRTAFRKDLAEASSQGLSKDRIEAMETRHRKAQADLQKRVDAVLARHGSVVGKVGLFEGAGYAAKGLYRPSMYCLMGLSPTDEYCPVCRRAIRRMIDFECGR